MPATVSDAARASRRSQPAEAEDSAIKAVFGDLARDGRTSPAPGFFDVLADAVAAMVARLAIIGVLRRRFAVTIMGMIWPDLSNGVPVWTLVDAENDANGKFLVARVQIDTEEEVTTMELFG